MKRVDVKNIKCVQDLLKIMGVFKVLFSVKFLYMNLDFFFPVRKIRFVLIWNRAQV